MTSFPLSGLTTAGNQVDNDAHPEVINVPLGIKKENSSLKARGKKVLGTWKTKNKPKQNQPATDILEVKTGF